MRARRETAVIPATVCKARRAALNMSQKHLADLANVPQPYVSRVERRESVRREDLEAIARVLDLDPDILMNLYEVKI